MRSLIFAILTLLFIESFSQSQIEQFRGPGRSGIYPEKNLLTAWPNGGPKLLWQFDSLGIGYSSPIVTSGSVYAAGTINTISYIFSFDHNGRLLWRKPLGPDYKGDWPGIYSTPVICGNYGYIVNSLGVLYCFSTENGNMVWSNDVAKEFNGQKAPSGFLDNLIVDGEKLYCTPGGKGKNVVALNRRNGDLIWTSGGDTIVNAYCTPILVENKGKKYFIYQTVKQLIALDCDNGKKVWSFKKRGRAMPNTPVYQNGYLLVPDYNYGSIKLKISSDWTGVTEVWHTPGLQTNMGDAIVLGDRIYGMGKGEKLYCADWNTGKELYSEALKNMVSTLISDGILIYSYQFNGTFNLLKPMENKFEKVGSVQIKGGGTENHCSHPVIHDGKLYVRHDNSLFVYNLRNAQP